MKIYLALLLLVLAAPVLGQPGYAYKSFGKRDGLSSDLISSVIRDEEGFIWIATANGLNRFDGNSFEVFLNNPANPFSLPNNEVNGLLLDKKGRLWVSTMAGLSLFDRHTQQFTNYAPPRSVLPRIGQLFPALAEDEHGNIWLGGWYDLLIFNTQTNRFITSGWASFANQIKPLSGNHSRIVVLSVQPAGEQKFWVLTTYGLFRVNTITKKFEYFFTDLLNDFYGCQMNTTDDPNKVWLGTYNKGLLCFDAKQQLWKHYPTPVKYRKEANWDWAYAFTKYNKDTFIYSTQLQSVLFVPATQTYLLAPPEVPNYAFTFTGGDQALQWKAGAEGLTVFYPKATLFNFHPVDANFKLSKIIPLNEQQALVHLEKQGQIGLYSTTTKIISPIGHTAPNLPAGNVFACKLNQNWFITTDQSAFEYDAATGKQTPVQLPALLIPANPRLLRNAVTHQQKLWLRDRRQGIIEMDLPSRQMHYLPIIAPNEQDTYTCLFYEEKTACLWIGVENEGLLIYDTRQGTVKQITLQVPPSEKGGALVAIAAGTNGYIYAADNNYGVFVLTNRGNMVGRITRTDGLASNNCNYLAADASGKIWISHTEGLSFYDPQKQRVTNFLNLRVETNYAAFIAANQNEFYMAARNGYYSWQPEQFVAQPRNGTIYLRRSVIDGQPGKIDSVFYLSANANNIGLQFGYRAFDELDFPDIQYRINGGNWFFLGGGRILSFTKPAPGNYFIEFREDPSAPIRYSIQLVVATPMYKKGWFIAVCLLAIAALVVLFIAMRLKAIQRKAALQQRIAAAEMMALRAQMNPHFIFNCINSIDHFILDNDPENASGYLNKFARLIRNVLDNSQHNAVPFWKDWETLKLYVALESLRSNHSFDCNFEAAPELLQGHYRVPPLAIQPYVENAILHGLRPLSNRQGKITIQAKLAGHQLHYVIEDNGIGRKAAATHASVLHRHQSYGMALSSERLRLFNNDEATCLTITDLYLPDGTAAGTRVEIWLNV